MMEYRKIVVWFILFALLFPLISSMVSAAGVIYDCSCGAGTLHIAVEEGNEAVACAKACGANANCVEGASEEAVECDSCCSDWCSGKSSECEEICKDRCAFLSGIWDLIDSIRLAAIIVAAVIIAACAIQYFISGSPESRVKGKRCLIYVVAGLIIIGIGVEVVRFVYFAPSETYEVPEEYELPLPPPAEGTGEGEEGEAEEGGGVTASFTADPVEGPATLTVNVDASASTGDITSHIWDCGGGTLSGDSWPTASCIFETDGTYTITLTVSDGLDTDSTTQEIIVDSEGEVAIAIEVEDVYYS